MTVYMFPGQGSQYKGMGKDLFEQFPLIIAEANMILGYSIQELCIEDPLNKLNLTQYTQPALYIVNALTYYKELRESSKKVNYFIGHSLGEYNALLAAEVFDFTTGLRLVKKRGELMGQMQDGSMAAILGVNAETLESLLKEQELFEIAIANYNSYIQKNYLIVLSQL